MNWAAKWGTGLGAVVLAAGLNFAPAAFAQVATPSPSGGGPQQESVNSMATELHDLTDVQRQSGIDPAQKDAYKKFFAVGPEEPDKKIELGTKFCKKYPNSPFTEMVDVGLTNAYYEKQDWTNFYAYADKVLSINPDEVDVLTTVGWVIPHEFDPHAPNAAQQLQTAETDEKHALDVLAKMPKPKNVTAEQFAALKAQKSAQAHSALGLIYFRRGDYASSVPELQQATQGASPDQTDLYVLGVDLRNLNRSADAATAFTHCSQIAGPLQAQCTKSAAQEK